MRIRGGAWSSCRGLRRHFVYSLFGHGKIPELRYLRYLSKFQNGAFDSLIAARVKSKQSKPRTEVQKSAKSGWLTAWGNVETSWNS